MRIARRMVVRGHVQGVGFRWFTKDVAMREGATGWVVNLPDGRVEVFVEGEAESVTRIERAVRRGPGRARVDDVVVFDEAASGACDSFTIK